MKSLVIAILALAFIVPAEAGVVKQSYKHAVKPAGKSVVKSAKFLKRVLY